MSKKVILVLQALLFLVLSVGCFRKEVSDAYAHAIKTTIDYVIDTAKTLTTNETAQNTESQTQSAESNQNNDVEEELGQASTTIALDLASSLYGGTKTTNSEWIGKYGFNETTYEYFIDLELEAANVDKESEEYDVYVSMIKQAYPYSVLEQSFGGVGFYFEYKGDGYLWGGTNQSETPLDLIQIDEDGKVTSATSSTYYGRFSDSVLWVNFDSLEIPFRKI